MGDAEKNCDFEDLDDLNGEHTVGRVLDFVRGELALEFFCILNFFRGILVKHHQQNHSYHIEGYVRQGKSHIVSLNLFQGSVVAF